MGPVEQKVDKLTIIYVNTLLDTYFKLHSFPPDENLMHEAWMAG